MKPFSSQEKSSERYQKKPVFASLVSTRTTFPQEIVNAAMDEVSAAMKRNEGDIDCCCVTFSDCIIDSGDDCITLRGNGRKLKRKRPCEFVTITNCVLHSCTNGIRIGIGGQNHPELGGIQYRIPSLRHCRHGLFLPVAF